MDEQNSALQQACKQDALAAQHSLRDLALAVLDALAPSKIAPVCSASFPGLNVPPPTTPGGDPMTPDIGHSGLLLPRFLSSNTPHVGLDTMATQTTDFETTTHMDSLAQLFAQDDLFTPSSPPRASPHTL